MLLVACVNVANLVLARATGRIHEFATRSALGSGSRRLVRQLLVESLLLAGLGGLMGLAVARNGTCRVLQRSWRRRRAAAGRGGVQPGGAGICPGDHGGHGRRVRRHAGAAFRATFLPSRRFDSNRVGATGTRGQGRLRNGLAAAQLALALTLLVGAGVLLASFHRLQQVTLGFRVEGVLTFDVNLPTIRYDAERRAAFQEELARRLRTIPGVTAAGGISFLPATGSYHGWNTSILSGPRAGTSVARKDGFNIQQRVVSGDTFAALDIPVLAGRTFDARDDGERAGPRGGEREVRTDGFSGHAVRQRRRASGLRPAAESSRSSASWVT